MTLAIVMLAGLALVLLGLAALLLRRTIVGRLIGAELGMGGLILLAAGLFDLTGTEISTGQVIALAIVGLTVAIGVAGTALHLAAARAERRGQDLDPW